jgi:16S rRNA (cytosine1402-N4)-methyltransferase
VGDDAERPAGVEDGPRGPGPASPSGPPSGFGAPDRPETVPEPAPEKTGRRPRYRGKNPRKFREKYKEHRPEHYADAVAKVIAGGKTPAGMHRPIMVSEILGVLAPRPGEVALDCTLGYGGHARALLAAVQPGGRLLGVDADPIELPRTEARLRALGFPPEALTVRRMNFAGLPPFVAAEAPGGVDVLLADLGLSSMQIDDPARGFTFKEDGPLDMRMNPARGRPASALLSTLDESGLARILADNADEPLAREISAAILRAHAHTPLASTRALAAVVRSAFGRRTRRSGGTADDAVRRVFQAIRIAVNDELGALEALLRILPSCLKPGGRVAILTFHSGEDRRVKSAFKGGLHDHTYASVAQRVIRASAEERRANPRSSAAKLRSAVRGGSS